MLPSRAPSSVAPNTIISQPAAYPSICVTRLVESSAYNVVTDGINPSLYAFDFYLSLVPGYTEFTNMFQTYCIEEIQFWLRPEYTVLSDSSALSNAVNVDLNSAIDLTNSTAPTAVNDVLEYQNAAHTSITQTHFRKFRPAWLQDAVAPVCARISTTSPTTKWYGLKVSVPPTGVAMTFRSIVKYKITFVGLK
jgi:hypothetical protein